ncbi:hypothetical protein FSB08_17075 [Paraburkholderia sp. JPY432]|uniref:hypothetical protein n=1 Tax=Paraburkholderia youngii TaxID=2782701 RepID=UPI001595AB74|nr:hypothetical protein [Paraburkholderia youngii]NVH74215.1 hypothetical protein [Paraburkholderia youngii]
MDQFASKREVIEHLARYLRVNPLASDTLEGIAQWWLGAAGVDPETLDEALAWLVAESIVERIQAADGRVRYRRVALDAVIDARLDLLIGAT